MSGSGLRIGITMRVLKTQDYYEPRDALAQDWSIFLNEVFPSDAWTSLPNLGADFIRTYCEKWGINRLLLSGGEDFGVSPIRDETEKDLLALAKERKMPVLGVCRGMQMMAMCAGVSLKPVNEHVRKRHSLHGDLTHQVNSFHKYGLAQCPPGFRVLARSEDGEIEAIRHLELPWEGWMWHPERESEFASLDIERLKALFS